MDATGLVAKVCAIEAELATKSSRIADPEAGASLPEAKSALLRDAMPARLEEDLGGVKQKSVEMVGERVGDDILDACDGKEGMATNANKGSGAEETVLVVLTPQIEGADGGGGGDHQGENNVDLGGDDDDDDGSITPRGEKRVLTSDWKDADGNTKADKGLEFALCAVVTGTRIKAESESVSEDDTIGLDEMKGCSTPATMHSSARQPMGERAVRRKIDFGEPKGCEEKKEEESNRERYSVIAEDWNYPSHMKEAFIQHPILCLKAVCALYLRQTLDERSAKATIYLNGEGFCMDHASRGTEIAEFLLNGDPSGPLKRTVQDLEKYDPDAVKYCREIATYHSSQLFKIYLTKKDPHFP